MFHGTLNHMKETLISMFFKLNQMTTYACHASSAIKIFDFKNFQPFNIIKLIINLIVMLRAIFC